MTKCNKDEVIRLANLYPSYAAVARELGISRERVRQIVGGNIAIPAGYVPITEIAAGSGYSAKYLRDRVFHHSILTRKIAHRIYVPDSIQIHRACSVCGNTLGKYKIRYCSSACASVGKKASILRTGFRRLRRKLGQKIDIPSLAYVRKVKNSS